MTSDRRLNRRNSLRSPAMARPNRLGDAVNQAIQTQHGETHCTMPPQYRVSRSGWGSGPAWRPGRSLSARTIPVQSPTWSYRASEAYMQAQQGGFALMEIMLVIGVIAIGTAGVVATYRVVDNNRKVSQEVEHARIIADNIVTHSMTAGDFSTINQVNALRDGLFPNDMLNADGDPKTKWNGDVLLTSADIGGKRNWGAVLTFEGVPASACSKLVTQAAPGFYGVSVNDEPVRTNYGAVDVSALAELCSQDGARVQFTYAKHGGAGESFDQVSPCTVPSPETDIIVDSACPTGQLGTITYRTDYVCHAPYGPATDLPPLEVSNTCAPQCILPTPSTETGSQTQTGAQTLVCPAGQTGTIEQTRPEQRTRTRTASCPPSPGYSGPIGTHTWSAWTPWSAWTGTAPWTTVTNTCAAPCLAPPAVATPYSQPATCPTGQSTPAGSTTFTQTRTGTRTPTCPAPTGPFTPGTEVFTPWTPLAATACAPICSAPPAVNTPTTRPAPPETQSLSCPAGQGGTWTQSRTRTENGTSRTTYTCQAPTGNYTTNPATLTWHGTYNATSPWSDTTKTCAPLCVAPPPTVTPNTRTLPDETRNLTCPNGQLGTWAQSRSRTENGTSTVAYSCPAPTGAYTPGPATQAWLGTYNATSPWVDTTNTCAPICVAPPSTTENESQSANCGTNRVTPGGATSFTQSRSRTITYSCPQSTGAYLTTPGTWSAWSPLESAACAQSCASIKPANTTETVTDSPGTQVLACPYFQTGQINQSRTVSRSRTVTYTCPAPTGGYTTSYGTWSAPSYGGWTTTSSNCALPACDGTIAGNARNYMSRYGDLYNAFGTDYNAAYNHWVVSGYYEGRGSCWAAPCTPPASQTQWVPTSDTACPAGTSGTRYYEIEQRRDGTCASPTGPAGHGGWYNTGAWRNLNVASCAPIYIPCTVTTALTRSWTDSVACNGTIPVGTYAHGSYLTVYPNSTLREGQAQFQCVNGTFSTTAAPGATCAKGSGSGPPCGPGTGTICP
jgi:type II secretory pathway pseudopilin PulG